jgi:peptidyl-prolyl cis-trans isomerase A (cyclophilin A)
MARITSKSKSQQLLKRKQKGLLLPVRLCIVFSLVGIILVIAYLLYQTDQAMFRQKIGSNSAATTQGRDRSMQKNILLSHQQQIQQIHRMKPNENNLRLKKSTAEEANNNAVESKQQQQQQQQQKAGDTTNESRSTRSVEFDLTDLKGGATGTITIETIEEWAPLGIARFWELIGSDFYLQCKMFRVVPNFIAQFGIASVPTEHAKWQHHPINDDPVLQSNLKNTITFAMSGKNTRTTQLFINMKDNTYLDQQGFAPIGRITSGIEYIAQINDQYKELPKQNKIVQEGNIYLRFVS